MATYQYVARTRQGKMVTGKVEGSDEATVARNLREQGLIPTSIELGSAVSKAPRTARGRRGGITIDDKVIMARQFAVMIRAGLPLLEVLNILSEQSDKISLKTIMKQVERDVETGSSLYEAVQKHPKMFDTFFVSMVRAGEAAGMLDTILDQVAIYLEKVAQIQRKVKSAVMYPAIVSVIAILITTFLLVKIVPVFVDIFDSLDGELPVVTQICVWLSNQLKNNLLGIGVFFAVIFASYYFASRTKGGRRFLDAFKLRMPIFGPLFLKVAVARFTRTLGVLIRSGVNILQALDIVARTAGNTVIEAAVYKTRASIQSGETIAQPLRESDVFPPMVVRMIDVGERTGALEQMLSKIAEFYEDQVDTAVAGLTALIEPLLIVFLGVLVGFIAVAMFLPLFKMVEQVG